MAKLVIPPNESMETLEAHLKGALPDCEVSLFGVIGKGIKVSNGIFAGAVVIPSPFGRALGVKARPVGIFAHALNLMTFGLLGLLGGSGGVRTRVRQSIAAWAEATRT